MYRRKRLPILFSVLILLTTGLAGCLAGDGGTGTGAFYVKDAPKDDWRHVNVTFTKVAVHRGGNDSGTWVTVAENQTGRTVDLLAFSSEDARALLGTSELQAGTYNQVLITVTEAYGIDAEDGSRVDFTLTQDELRLTRAWKIAADQTTRVIADLDLSRSIVKQGNQGYRFNPVIGQILVEQGVTGTEGDVRGGSPAAGTDGGQDGGTSTASATTYVKDAPTDEFDEIWISFTKVEVHRAAENGTDNGTENGTEDDGAWVATFTGNRSVNLLNFSEDGARAFLGETTLDVGRYTQVRIHVSEAWGIQNGSRVAIETANTTAKVVQSFEVVENATNQIVIDLDLDRSLVKQGGGGQGGQGGGQDGGQRDATWRLTPVIGNVVVDHVEDDPRQDVPDQAA